MVIHGDLQKIHAFQTAYQFLRCEKHDHGGAAADHQCVDKYAQSLKQSGLDRMADVCGSCRTGSGSGSGFIGKKSAFGAVHDYCSDAATHGLPQTEGFCEYPLEDARQLACIPDDDIQGNQKIKSCHERNDNIQYLYGSIFPQHDYSRKDD